jgi:hypothetical protein
MADGVLLASGPEHSEHRVEAATTAAASRMEDIRQAPGMNHRAFSAGATH